MSDTVGIVGSRDWQDLQKVRAYVHTLPDLAAVVSGGARGVDRMAEGAALERGLPVLSYRPKKVEPSGLFIIEVWENGQFAHTDGRAFSKFATAAFFRNGLIVKACDYLVAFQRDSSRGTQDSIDRARAAGKDVVLFEETSE